MKGQGKEKSQTRPHLIKPSRHTTLGAQKLSPTLGILDASHSTWCRRKCSGFRGDDETNLTEATRKLGQKLNYPLKWLPSGYWLAY